MFEWVQINFDNVLQNILAAFIVWSIVKSRNIFWNWIKLGFRLLREGFASQKKRRIFRNSKQMLRAIKDRSYFHWSIRMEAELAKKLGARFVYFFVWSTIAFAPIQFFYSEVSFSKLAFLFVAMNLFLLPLMILQAKYSTYIRFNNVVREARMARAQRKKFKPPAWWKKQNNTILEIL